LERPDLRAPSNASSSRERVVSLDRWLTNVLVPSDAGRARTGDDTETLPSVRLPVIFANGTLVANRYEIRRRSGRGGMGQVYEAYDCVLRQQVALKTTTSQRSKGPERLLDEVRMARRISHANVCQLYDAGLHEDREPQRRTTYFISMEYLEGHTLRHRLRHGLPSLPQVFGIARQLLIGLTAIHDAGVLHRDFKSENVMLRLPGNGTGQAVIMDFGLAQTLEEAASLGPLTGIGAGSHGYMAPEQVDNLPLGPETDLFAFGVVMYEMLTGRLPFARDGLKTTTSNLPDQVATPPSQLRAELPPELDAFVLKCMSACPSRRYRTAERALVALTRIFEASSPRVRGSGWALGTGFPRRGARFLRRSPGARAASA
jgi:serine/threonine protein kinase